MIIYFHGEKHSYVLTFDIEFDMNNLVQFAGILFKNLGDGKYFTYRTLNAYVKCSPSYQFQRYTGLTTNFLQNYGVTLKDLVQQVEDDLLKDVDKTELLVVSHGLRNDRKVLLENFINLNYDSVTINPIDGYCTFNNARRILGRKNNLKLEDVAREACIYPDNSHNAFADS